MPTTSGDKAAPRARSVSEWFSDEVHPHEPSLRAFLKRRFPALTDLDDLVQETYARILRRGEPEAIGKPKAYLFRAALNAVYNSFHQEKKVVLAPLDEVREMELLRDREDVAETVSHAQEIELMTEAIEALPERCRMILTMCRLHGLSYRETARRLGISESTVNGQVVIGLVRCRAFMRARGVSKGGDHG